MKTLNKQLVFATIQPYYGGRGNLTLFTSTDQGRTWDMYFTAESGISLDLDMIQLNSRNIGIIYQTGLHEIGRAHV